MIYPAHVFFFILAMFIAKPAYPEDDPVTPESVCASLSELAGTVLRARDNGLSLTKALSNSQNQVVREVILAAYREPRYVTPEVQSRQRSEFSDNVHLECLQALGE